MPQTTLYLLLEGLGWPLRSFYSPASPLHSDQRMPEPTLQLPPPPFPPGRKAGACSALKTPPRRECSGPRVPAAACRRSWTPTAGPSLWEASQEGVCGGGCC
jgi:hypothetical protein